VLRSVFLEDDVACELTTGSVLCGNLSRALKSRKSDCRKTATQQSLVYRGAVVSVVSIRLVGLLPLC